MRRVWLIILFFAVIPTIASAASLSVSPNSKTITVGDTFDISIHLDTEGGFVDGVDIVYLNFNPTILQVQDSNLSMTGIQIATGTLLLNTLADDVDNTLGKISLSQIYLGGGSFKGSGILATITFKALKVGTSNLTFDYEKDNTKDCNTAFGGVDILSSVSNGTYLVNNPPSPPVPPGGGSSYSSGSGSYVGYYLPNAVPGCPIGYICTLKTTTNTSASICPPSLICTPKLPVQGCPIGYMCFPKEIPIILGCPDGVTCTLKSPSNNSQNVVKKIETNLKPIIKKKDNAVLITSSSSNAVHISTSTGKNIISSSSLAINDDSNIDTTIMKSSFAGIIFDFFNTIFITIKRGISKIFNIF